MGKPGMKLAPYWAQNTNTRKKPKKGKAQTK